jgi:hypothetical protein
MSFDQRLRAAMQRANENFPRGPAVEWEKTMARARRGRYLNLMAVGFATAAVIALAILGGDALLERSEGPPPLPAGTPSPSVSPSPTAPPEPTCSAARMSDMLTDQDLPRAVARMRRQIAEAAVHCDYGTLEELALSGDDLFTYISEDDGNNPGGYWRRLEEEEPGEDVLAILVQTLDLEYCTEDTQSAGVTWYFWPSVQCTNSTEEDYDNLAASRLYTDEEIQMFKQNEYGGYRVAITEKGDWVLYVGGQ